MSGLEGTATLARALVRRDRVRMGLWVSATTLLVLVTASSTKAVYPTAAELAAAAATVRDNPAALALNGPDVALDTLGGQVSFQLGAFGLVMVALMTVLLTGRATRGEEEAGRIELVRALPVGRRAPLTAAVVVIGALDLVVGALCSAVLVSQGLPGAGSVVLGAGLAVEGLLFLGLTVLTAQLSENARVASGLAGAVLGAAYALRALGDATGGALSWLSPVGLAQKAKPYGGDVWWPLAACAALGLVLLAVAVVLHDRRDLGGGLVPPRPGPARGGPSLGSALGLVVRLQRATVFWWAVGIVGMAVVFGALAGSVEDFVDDSEALAEYFGTEGSAGIVDGYLGTTLLLMAILPAGAAVQLLLRSRTEEAEGRADAVLATPTSRLRWQGANVGLVLVTASGIQVLSGAVVGLTAAASLGDSGEAARVAVASLAYLPALWVVAGATAALVGAVPRASYAAWAGWGLCLVLAWFATLIDVPSVVAGLSPFHHVPAVPAEDPAALPLLALIAVAAALLAVGAAGMRRRDVG